MKQARYLTFFLLSWMLAPSGYAREFVGNNQTGGNAQNPNTNTQANQQNGYRASCVASRAETDLNINNVRARLLAGGDVWYDIRRGRGGYIVPNVDPASGQNEVSSLYAGAIWLGAYDGGGNLVLAGQKFRADGNDFWPGPLDPATGTVEKAVCEKWDRHFRVLGADIDALRADFFAPDANGQPDQAINGTPSRALQGWPARGNAFFSAIYGFDLPNQDLAPFIDAPGPGNTPGIYEPDKGDHPIIEVAGCSNGYNNPVYADEMVWWVFNDKGNVHGSSGQPMFMEVQALAFSYRTTDAINNMTFYRYKLLNRNSLPVNRTYFSVWSDPDLGCFRDDYIGCDTATGMGYVYNSDANDDVNCGGGTGSGFGYGTDIPALAVDYFRGPLDENGRQIGLSSFMYHLSGSGQCTNDPTSALGYYRLLTGHWPLTNEPVTRGNTGCNPGSTDTTRFVFPSFPNDQTPGAWSMCQGGNIAGNDFRFLHISGPFTLLPGATNELITGVVWVPDLPDYPCPSLRELVQADVLAQNLFDDCFKITDGPDAPFMDIVELENELLLNLYYTPGQNNNNLGYIESPALLRGTSDTTYNFQGFKIYQVKDPNASVTDLEDPALARLLFQTDLQDSVSKIVNWTPFPDADIRAFVPSVMVDGENKGIKQSFQVNLNAFATRDPKLVNHQPYYFAVVAYAHNEYQSYNPSNGTGQATPYLQGRRNFRIYTGIPRNNSPEYFGATINSKHGQRPEVTRVDGKGNGGGLFLDIFDEASFENSLLAGNAIGRVTYKEGAGPIDVKIVDPLRIPKGTFQLYIGDRRYVWNRDASGIYTPVPFPTATTMTDSLFWVLKDSTDATKIWYSYQPLTLKYEQLVSELGISLSIQKISPPGFGGISGWIGSSVVYDSTQTSKIGWYQGVLDESSGTFNMLKTGNSQADNALDPQQDYSKTEAGWVPVLLCDCQYDASEFYFSASEIEKPAGGGFCDLWRSNVVNQDKILGRQRNVNVVITPDKSKWSRCIVTESATQYHRDGLGLTPASGLDQLNWKKAAPSVDKDGNTETGSQGMSWFPGFAYDVETGERLNIFFGENSIYNTSGGAFFDPALYPKATTGNDMIYNPTDLRQIAFGVDNATRYISSVLGGQHIIYVADSRYDSCAALKTIYNLPPSTLFSPPYQVLRRNALIWASYGYLKSGISMEGAKQNIPPSEVKFKLRVGTPYEIYRATDSNKGYPLYSFNLDKYATVKAQTTVAKTALDLMNVVPNPYYAYSDYEVNEIDNVIKITNVPPKANIRIYSIDGRFIRQYTVAQDYPTTIRNGVSRLGQFGSGEVENQITTSVNWDLKNSAGVPVSSGVYLIHVVVDGVGERVLKSFLINRAFDAQKL